ncbi:hypothetical protein O181_120276 [Austropuccinia psidii MF-1]|uniref:Uncharacterized protein n=1 Tax=Austropuccinia psidii MF-1 TaxID=1389203 RepID=A0A9Q3KHC1_9BASI|nr:hypothetical protein [Austropuccinia psidii MF-1]
MNSYLHIKCFLGQEKTIEPLGGWSPLSYKDKVKKIKNWLKNKSILSVDQKKELEMTPVASTSSRSIQREAQRTSEEEEMSKEQSGQGKSQRKLAQTFPTRVQDP